MSQRFFKISLIIAVVLALTLLILSVYFWQNSSALNLLGIFLSIISTATTIIALLYAFKPKPKFKGKVYCWNIRKSEFPAIGDTNVEHQNITFLIHNTSGMSLSNLQVSLRIPGQLVHPYKDYSHYGLNTRIIKETYVYTLVESTFLGNSYGDDDYLLEQSLCLQKWDKGNIYLTIWANEIETSTFKLDKRSKLELINSNSGEKLIMPAS